MADSSLSDAECDEIAAWARGRLVALGEPAAIVVDRKQTPGHPQLGERTIYAHPEDYLALHRWAAEHDRWWF